MKGKKSSSKNPNTNERKRMWQIPMYGVQPLNVNKVLSYIALSLPTGSRAYFLSTAYFTMMEHDFLNIWRSQIVQDVVNRVPRVHYGIMQNYTFSVTLGVDFTIENDR